MLIYEHWSCLNQLYSLHAWKQCQSTTSVQLLRPLKRIEEYKTNKSVSVWNAMNKYSRIMTDKASSSSSPPSFNVHLPCWHQLDVLTELNKSKELDHAPMSVLKRFLWVNAPLNINHFTGHFFVALVRLPHSSQQLERVNDFFLQAINPVVL